MSSIAISHARFYNKESFNALFPNAFQKNNCNQIVQFVDPTGKAYELDYLVNSGTIVLYSPYTPEEAFITFKYGGQMTFADILAFLGFKNPNVGLTSMSDSWETFDGHFSIQSLLEIPLRTMPRCQLVVGVQPA